MLTLDLHEITSEAEESILGGFNQSDLDRIDDEESAYRNEAEAQADAFYGALDVEYGNVVDITEEGGLDPRGMSQAQLDHEEAAESDRQRWLNGDYEESDLIDPYYDEPF